ncbi:RNA recognition motif (or rnp domain)-containing protein [Cyclospora cayetanensis]|uniref:RNA recognition motif (Or rnp domain)-containing protein n=1 Tax=Cyclospora cayetanensis TaxID=88456 RepID=A0A1D3D5T0_9EIME|nr:RNA recognition motif (or rnp domain)-containing protein [Cyclospora cayetanensis]
MKAVLRPRQQSARGGLLPSPAAAAVGAVGSAGNPSAIGAPARVCLTPRQGEPWGHSPATPAVPASAAAPVEQEVGAAAAAVDLRGRLQRVSHWAEGQPIETQMEDFKQLHARFRHTIRYLLLSNLPPRLQQQEALLEWHRQVVEQPLEVHIELIKPHQAKQQEEEEGQSAAVEASANSESGTAEAAAAKTQGKAAGGKSASGQKHRSQQQEEGPPPAAVASCVAATTDTVAAQETDSPEAAAGEAAEKEAAASQAGSQEASASLQDRASLMLCYGLETAETCDLNIWRKHAVFLRLSDRWTAFSFCWREAAASCIIRIHEMLSRHEIICMAIPMRQAVNASCFLRRLLHPFPRLLSHELRERMERSMRYGDEGLPPRVLPPPHEFGVAAAPGGPPFDLPPGRRDLWGRRGPPIYVQQQQPRRGAFHPEDLEGPYGGPYGPLEGREREQWHRQPSEASPAAARERREGGSGSGEGNADTSYRGGSSNNAATSDLLSLLRQRLMSGSGGGSAPTTTGAPKDEGGGDGKRGGSTAAGGGAALEKESDGKDPLLQLLQCKPELLDHMLLDLARERLQRQLARGHTKGRGGPPEGAVSASRSASTEDRRGNSHGGEGVSKEGPPRSSSKHRATPRSSRSRSASRTERRLRGGRRHRSTSSGSGASSQRERGPSEESLHHPHQLPQRHDRRGRIPAGPTPQQHAGGMRTDGWADVRAEPWGGVDASRDSKRRRIGGGGVHGGSSSSAAGPSMVPLPRGCSPGGVPPGGRRGHGLPPSGGMSGSGVGGASRGGWIPAEGDYEYESRCSGGRVDRELLLVCRVSKQGQHLCSMSAKFVMGDPSLQPPTRLDVNQRANLERLQSNLLRGPSRSHDSGSSPAAVGKGTGGGARFSAWQMGADSAADSRHYDALCDYFIEKQRLGLLEDSRTAIYMVPPNPKYIRPLGRRAVRLAESATGQGRRLVHSPTDSIRVAL